jgi:autotransporter-associated beta strand protein
MYGHHQSSASQNLTSLYRNSSRRTRFPGCRICLLASLFWIVAATGWAQPDYPSALWVPTPCAKWYTSGNGRSFIVIHDMEGYYETSISYLNRCDLDTSGNYVVSASVHYLVNGLQNGPGENNPGDGPAGEITQSVREANYAWHAVCLNKWSFGTEHEGFVSNPAWYTEAMYVASAALQRHLCTNYGIPMNRNRIVGHGEWKNYGWVTYMAANFPSITVTCNSHTDPGIFWDWPHFMTLITGTNYGNYWDMNGASAGAGNSPSGTWDLTSTNWSYDPTGVTNHGIWGGKIAIFAAGADANSSYTVTVSGVQYVNGLHVQEGNPTFTGGQLDFSGDGSFFTNYVGAGLTATFNTPFGGPSSPDKWGTGTAVYNGASTSGGFHSLNQGTLALGNNAALGTVRLVVGDSSGANFVTIKSPDATAHTFPNKLTLNANSFSFGAGGNLTFTGPIDVGASNSTTTVIAVSNSITTLSGTITNTGGLAKTGPGMLVLSGAAANTFGATNSNGSTTVSGGILKLSKTAGVDAVANGALVLNLGGTVQLGAADQINDAVSMTLVGGVFQPLGFSEQLGTLKLAGSSQIDFGLGASAAVVQFAASAAIGWTAGPLLTISNWNGSLGGGGGDQLFFGTNGSGLTVGQVNQLRFANPSGLPPGVYNARLLSSGEVVPFTVAPVISLQPTNRIAVAGDTIAFNSSATGIPAPGFQWSFNGSALPSATGANLVLNNVNTNQTGNYFVIATNAAGVTNSLTATLTVYQTAAATLGAPGYSTNGQFALSVTGVPTYRYAIQVSSNLIDWVSLQTNASPLIYTDFSVNLFPARFYRAQFVP